MFEGILSLSAVTAAVSFAVAETKLFASFREWIKTRNAFLGGLFSCGYCFGHWVAFGLVAIYRPRLFDAWRPLDYFLTALVIAWIAAFQWAVMCWLMEKARK